MKEFLIEVKSDSKEYLKGECLVRSEPYLRVMGKNATLVWFLRQSVHLCLNDGPDLEPTLCFDFYTLMLVDQMKFHQ